MFALAVHLLRRFLDNHCANADAEGMSALCECRLCLDTRRHLARVDPFASTPTPTPTMAGKLRVVRGGGRRQKAVQALREAVALALGAGMCGGEISGVTVDAIFGRGFVADLKRDEAAKIPRGEDPHRD